MQILSSRPALRPVSVAAYLDGTASAIEADVLKGHDQFVRADRSEAITVEISGTRLTPGNERLKSAAYFAGAGAALALGVAVGMMGSPEVGTLIGLTALPPAFLGVRHRQASLTATSFLPGQPDSASSHAQRFLAALQDHQEGPNTQTVAYLSGHGSHRGIAGLNPALLGDVLSQSPVDLTILDACSTAQIEILSQMGPSAGMVLCSVHPVPGKGLPIERMLEPSEDLAASAYQQAGSATGSLSLVDSTLLQTELLPALDNLGQNLAQAVTNGQRREVKAALVKSRNPDVFGARVELKSFLDNLAKEELGDNVGQSLELAQAALTRTVVKNTGSTLTFRLDGAQDSALPKGWQNFVDTIDSRHKPMLLHPWS